LQPKQIRNILIAAKYAASLLCDYDLLVQIVAQTLYKFREVNTGISSTLLK